MAHRGANGRSNHRWNICLRVSISIAAVASLVSMVLLIIISSGAIALEHQASAALRAIAPLATSEGRASFVAELLEDPTIQDAISDLLFGKSVEMLETKSTPTPCADRDPADVCQTIEATCDQMQACMGSGRSGGHHDRAACRSFLSQARDTCKDFGAGSL